MPGGVRALAAYLLGMRSVSGVSQRQQTDHLGLLLAPRPHPTPAQPPIPIYSRLTPDMPLRALYKHSYLSNNAATLSNAGYPSNRPVGPRAWPGGSAWGMGTSRAGHLARHWARDTATRAPLVPGTLGALVQSHHHCRAHQID